MFNNIIKNIIYSIGLTLIVFLVGLTFVFSVMQLFPGDPVLAFLPGSFTPQQYQAVYERLGLNQPLFIRYFKFIIMFISGEWGLSISLNPGQAVFQLLNSRIFVDLNFTVLPIIGGIILGMVLGIYSVKVKYKWFKYFIQIFIILGIAIPIFSFGIFLQYYLAYQLDLFPVIGDPTLPAIILFLTTSSLMTRQFRSNLICEPAENHILPNTLKTVLNFGIIFVSILFLEITFNLHGLIDAFIVSIPSADYWVGSTTISLIVTLTAIIIFISNVCFTIYNYLIEKGKFKSLRSVSSSNEELMEKNAHTDLISSKNTKNFIIYRLKSPLTIIGLIILVFSIIISIFPQILTPYSVEQTLSVYTGEAFNPPSVDHPLGQSLFGRDVLALLVYGVRNALVIGIIPVFIGLIGGILFGYLLSLNKIARLVLIGLMILMFAVPTIVIIILYDGIFPLSISLLLPILGIFLIPGFTMIFGENKFRIGLLIKKLIVYFPLLMGFTILFIEGLSFITIINDPIIQLGRNVSDARSSIATAPWASLWPGFAIFMIAMGLFILHYGLKEPLNKRK